MDRIRTYGLELHCDAAPPPQLLQYLGSEAGNIVALHPLGAKLRPRGGGKPPLVTLALSAEDLPKRVGLDWSYIPHPAEPPRAFGDTLERIVLFNARQFGSVISYDAIEPAKLRIFVKGKSPIDPLAWPSLADANLKDAFRHE